MSDETRMESPAEDSSGKMAYHAPELRVYGKIREITQGVGETNQKDSPPIGSAKSNKSLP